MSAFIAPVLLTVIVALISAVLLTIAGKIFFVPVDETAAKIRECLSGANCGACGYAGCDDYANALAADHSIPCTLCAPGGASAANGIAEILGLNAAPADPTVACVMCSGTNDVTKPEMDYQGYKTCASVKGFFGGPGSCKFGCIGFGDCVAACKFDAIHVENGVAKVDRDKCVGCGACSKTCPQRIIDMIPKTSRVWVGCSSCDPGKSVRALCEVGCIACKICEKQCKFEAIKVENNIAKIDPEKCKNCGLCAKKCPRKIIHMIDKNGKPVAIVDAPKPAPAAPSAAPAAPAAEKPAEAPAPAEAPQA